MWYPLKHVFGLDSDSESQVCERTSSQWHAPQVTIHTKWRRWNTLPVHMDGMAMNDHKINREKPSKKLSQDNLSLRRFSQKWVGEKRGKSTGGSKNPCLSCLSLAQCKPTFMIFPQWGRRVWKQRNEIWVFLNYFKYEIALEDISKENCGKKKTTMPFYKIVFFFPNWDCSSQLKWPY